MNSLRIIVFVCILFAAFSYAQEGIDFTNGLIKITIEPEEGSVGGTVDYQFYSALRTDSVELDARNMTIEAVRVNRKKVDFSYRNDKLTIYRKLKADKSYDIQIDYSATPKKALYFVGWHDDNPNNNQVWTQGQGKYSSHWVPSFDNMSEKVEFDLEITFEKGYDVVANGVLEGTEDLDSLQLWKYRMNKPMSSYLLAFAIGQYEEEKISSKSGIPILLYTYQGKSDRLEPTYRYTNDIMDFLEKEMAVPYPWQNYKQIPVRDFLYAGMENTGTTIFSDSYLIDSLAYEDKNYFDVNAHEMAHQWFGNLVTEVSAKDHWLHEGFATYYALLAGKEIIGDDYFYWKLFDSAEALKDHKEETLVDPGASSLTFYEKGAWAIVMLRDLVGDQAFKNGIKRFLETFAFNNATVEDFLEIMRTESGADLKEFETNWLRSASFPIELAKEYLKRESASVNAWYEMRWELTASNETNEEIIRRYWEKMESEYFRRHTLAKFNKSLSISFIKEIFKSDSAELRKTLAVYMERIPPELQSEFESLLDDDSYITRESALFKLWIYFPAKRKEYLEKTRGIVGLNHYNVRIMWLFLAVLTQDFDTMEERNNYRQELFQYTSPEYSFEIRQNAFSVITEVFQLSEQNLRDLVNASVHPVWQFRSFARNMLNSLLEDKKQLERLSTLVEELNGEEQRYLLKQLESK